MVSIQSFDWVGFVTRRASSTRHTSLIPNLFRSLSPTPNSLTKNYRERPKYPELLESDFLKTYENAHVDVSAWFASVTKTKEADTNTLQRR